MPKETLADSKGDGREARGEIDAVARVDHHLLAVLVQLYAVAVEFDLVQPIVALGRAITQGGIGRDDERRGMHGLKCRRSARPPEA